MVSNNFLLLFPVAADPANDAKNRVDCPGLGAETCPVVYK